MPDRERWEEIAQRLHDAYERLAPAHGYETRHESRIAWHKLPENHRALMTAAVAEAVAPDAAAKDRRIAELEAEVSALRAKLADAEKERDELRARLDAYLASETFASVELLRALREHAPQAAEEVARWLWAPWEDGSVPSVHLWGLLDAEGLTTAFERMREARHRRRKEADRG